MSAYGCIPLAGLDVFPIGAFLEIDFSLAIEYMQVHHGMQEHRAIMALGACGLANDIAGWVYKGEEFLGSFGNEQTAISIGEEAEAILHSVAVYLPPLFAHNGGNQQKEGTLGLVEIGHHGVDDSPLEAGSYHYRSVSG